MKLEETDGALRALAYRLFGLAEELTGEKPQWRESKGVYKVRSGGRVMMLSHNGHLK
jgi:hypothetical protein